MIEVCLVPNITITILFKFDQNKDVNNYYF